MAVTAGALTSAEPASSSINGLNTIQRGVEMSDSFTLPTSSANAVVFPFAAYSAGEIYVSGACTITWYVSHTQLSGLKAAYDDSSTPVAITQVPAAEGWYMIPAKLFPAPYIAPVIASGTITCRIALKK